MRCSIFSQGRGRVLALAMGLGFSAVSCTGVLGGSDSKEDEASQQRGSGEGQLTTPDGSVVHYEPASTPLARLTNDEFFQSAIDALNIPADATGLAEARTRFPAEAMVGGVPNDVQVQRLTQVAILGYTNMAAAAADVFLTGVTSQAELMAKMGCDEGAEFSGCLEQFGLSLMRRAYRRELSEEHTGQLSSSMESFEQILQSQAGEPSSLESDFLRVKTVIRTALISPDFLLIIEKGEAEGLQKVSAEEIAARLSYLLLGEPPDEELRAAASAGELQSSASRLEHAERLLESQLGSSRVRNAMMGWLGVNTNQVEPASVSALSDFIGDWFDGRRPFSDFYEAPIPVEHVDGTISEEPVGVLGMDAFLGSHTFPPTSAFITRGVFVVERLLCAELPDDIPAEAFESEEVRTDAQVFDVHDKAACASCHRVFDNYGAALHQFDGATSLYSPGPTVLGSGFELYEFEGISGLVDGPQDLGAILAASERAPRCMAELWFRTAMRRSLDPKKDDTLVVDVLMETWRASNDTSLKSLLLALVASEHFVAFVP